MNLTLGQFIEKLKLLKPEADITFDFELLYPDCFDLIGETLRGL